jgi:serine/threonine protein kinase
MAPQLLSLSKYSSKSELWSLGIIFYQLLFTNTPWHPISCVQELVKKIYTDCKEKRFGRGNGKMGIRGNLEGNLLLWHGFIKEYVYFLY